MTTHLIFEGPDSVGKSSLIAQLISQIPNERPVLSIREPGGTPLAEDIRTLLKRHQADMNPLTSALLFQAARSALEQHVLSWRAAHPTGLVLQDRSWLSTIIYQGAQLPEAEQITALRFPVPTTTVILTTHLSGQREDMDFSPAIDVAAAYRAAAPRYGALLLDPEGEAPATTHAQRQAVQQRRLRSVLKLMNRGLLK